MADQGRARYSRAQSGKARYSAENTHHVLYFPNRRFAGMGGAELFPAGEDENPRGGAGPKSVEMD